MSSNTAPAPAARPRAQITSEREVKRLTGRQRYCTLMNGALVIPIFLLAILLMPSTMHMATPAERDAAADPCAGAAEAGISCVFTPASFGGSR